MSPRQEATSLQRRVLGSISLATVVVACILALVAGATDSAAHDDHFPDLFFDANGGGTLGTHCAAGQAPPYNECHAPAGGTFPVSLYMQTTPDLAWEYAQFSLTFEGVTAKEDPSFAGIPEECDEPANVDVDVQPGSVVLGCTVPTPTQGVLVAHVLFNCTETVSHDNEITLRVGVGDDDSYVVDGFGDRHSEATQEESMFIDCVEPDRADMHLEVTGGDAVCDSLPAPTACDVAVGDSFSVAVATGDPPDDGYFGFTTVLLYGDLQYKAAPDDPDTFPFNEGWEVEAVWPGADYGGRDPFYDLTGKEGWVEHAAYGAAGDYTGSLVVLSMTCQQSGATAISLVAFDYPTDGARFYRPEGIDPASGYVTFLYEDDTIAINCLGPQAVGGVSLGDDLALPSTGSGPSTLLWLVAGVIAATVPLGGVWYARGRWQR
jgi:hypothetical protein